MSKQIKVYHKDGKRWENYLSGAVVGVYKAYSDLDTPFLVIHYTMPAVQRQVRVEAS
jgi:hypothetical protein